MTDTKQILIQARIGTAVADFDIMITPLCVCTRPVRGSVMRSRADRLVRARVPLHSSSPRPASWSAPSVLSVPILFRRERTLNQCIYYCVAVNPHIHIASVSRQISPAIDPPSTVALLYAWTTSTGNQLSDRRECGFFSIESIVFVTSFGSMEMPLR